MDILDQYVHMRFRSWTNRTNLWIIYEAFPEEGPGISKKLREFKSEEDCVEWLDHHRAAYKVWLQSFVVTTATSPATSAPSALTTTSFLQREKKKLKEASERQSALRSRETSQTTPSMSSEMSTSQSSTASNNGRRIIQVQANLLRPNDVFYWQEIRYTVENTLLAGLKIRIHRCEAEDPLIIDQDTIVSLELP